MKNFTIKIDQKKSIAEIEEEYGIVDEVDDVRPWNLGHHPSKTYYNGSEPDYAAMRRTFERRAAKYDLK